MIVKRTFNPFATRYDYDTDLSSLANGFAQIDTAQDASHYGTWCSPSARTLINFAEGDIVATFCRDDAEFIDQIRALVAWNDEAGYGPARIDPANSPALRAQFERLGLADLLH